MYGEEHEKPAREAQPAVASETVRIVNAADPAGREQLDRSNSKCAFTLEAAEVYASKLNDGETVQEERLAGGLEVGSGDTPRLGRTYCAPWGSPALSSAPIWASIPMMMVSSVTSRS